ncbi:hypothetical protein MKX01_030994, partial [Papaver californicum]
MNEDGYDWNSDLVKQLFEPYEATQILNTYISNGENDKLIWMLTPRGEYSAQSFQKALILNAVNHLFLQCPVTQAILFACPLSLRLQDSHISPIKELLASWLMIQDEHYTYNLG